MSTESSPIGILGAGLAGLTVAWYLQRAGVPYRLLERCSQPGGYIRSMREGAYLRELGPNSLLLDTNTRTLLNDLELNEALIPANPVGNDRFVFRRGAYRKLPSGPLSLLIGYRGERPFFGINTLLALWRERSLTSRSPEGETLAEFFERRFSPELVEYALDPFVAGIYAGDPQQLLVSSTFPSLLDYETRYGSVLKGFFKNQGSQRRESVSFRNGLQTLTNALAQNLTDFEPDTEVFSVAKSSDSTWQLHTSRGTAHFQKLVVTAPAFGAAEWFRESLPRFSEALNQISYPPMTVVHTAFRRADVAHPLRGFGGLNPAVEGRFAAGHLWSSSVFDQRCPSDEVLLTSFVGGTQAAQHARLPEGELLRRLGAELREAFNISGEPTFQRVFRWERAIPQYDANALPAQRLALSYEAEGLYVCANWLGGVSLSDGLEKGRRLAEKLVVLR
ncbi:MAG: protoporphyrinogen oxidase [Sphingobacteriaceae bacterium]|nr:protoporphyrinogen oxidase [Cytophagaceae bacterium]